KGRARYVSSENFGNETFSASVAPHVSWLGTKVVHCYWGGLATDSRSESQRRGRRRTIGRSLARERTAALVATRSWLRSGGCGRRRKGCDSLPPDRQRRNRRGAFDGNR